MDPMHPVLQSRIARRPLFALAASLGLGLRARAGAEDPAGAGPIDLDTFVREAVPVAHQLIGDTTRIGQDRYLLALAAIAARLRDVPLPEEMRPSKTEAIAKTYLGAHDFDAPFTLLHWRMDPGSRVGLHPHIYGNVVTVCLEGEVRIENYEMLGERDFERVEPFHVRRTNDQVLTAGCLNLVSLEHGYMHGFEAGPNGAHGLDITTRIREKRPTPTLVLEPDAVDVARRIFSARWKV
jgi:hypothetical protein